MSSRAQATESFSELAFVRGLETSIDEITRLADPTMHEATREAALIGHGRANVIEPTINNRSQLALGPQDGRCAALAICTQCELAA
jgi:hypothetical protein